MEKQPTCKERIQKELDNTLENLRKFQESGWDSANLDGDGYKIPFNEYGLSFDYVAPHTFNEQEQGYFRYQLSWGGPSDEFRFYVNPDLSCYSVEYAFLDWFDGSTLELSGDDKNLLLEVYDLFESAGICRVELDRSAV